MILFETLLAVMCVFGLSATPVRFTAIKGYVCRVPATQDHDELVCLTGFSEELRRGLLYGFIITSEAFTQ